MWECGEVYLFVLTAEIQHRIHKYSNVCFSRPSDGPGGLMRDGFNTSKLTDN